MKKSSSLGIFSSSSFKAKICASTAFLTLIIVSSTVSPCEYQRIERTNYYYTSGRPYAETVSVITLQGEYLGGSWVTVRESQNISTNYTDGSKRESEIIISWYRNQYGLPYGKNGSGIIVGSNIINGNSVDYTGSITIDYGLDNREGFYKIGYKEKLDKDPLNRRLPFELIFIDDRYLRPIT